MLSRLAILLIALLSLFFCATTKSGFVRITDEARKSVATIAEFRDIVMPPLAYYVPALLNCFASLLIDLLSLMIPSRSRPA